MEYSFHPLTMHHWDAFTRLFGEKGACGGCWCMHWRLTAAAFNAQRGECNRQAMHALVIQGKPVGVMAFERDIAVGWCAVAPRAEYPRFNNSRILKSVDAAPVWSVTCFYIAKQYRMKGMSVPLLNAAVAYATANGAAIVEGYPVEPSHGKQPDVFVWTGLAATFIKAGFTEVVRRSKVRPIMRLVVTNS